MREQWSTKKMESRERKTASIERIEQILEKCKGRTLRGDSDVRIRFAKYNWAKSEELDRLNKSLYGAVRPVAVELLLELLWLWRACGTDNPNDFFYYRPMELATKIFGSAGGLDQIIGRRLMFTLTEVEENAFYDNIPRPREFRCWYGRPASIRPTHVDSDGEGLLFEVKGEGKAVGDYMLKTLDRDAVQRSIHLRNGVYIYGLDFG